MPIGAFINTVGCARCRGVFELPSLGEMTYGEFLLHGERGAVHRYVSVLDHPAYGTIEALLTPPGGAIGQSFHVLAALADPVDGQRLRVEPVCPHCQADGTHFRTPRGASKTPRIGEVEDATFNTFLSLTVEEQRRCVAAVVGGA